MHCLVLALLLAAKAPNVLLIVADDHGWPDFGFMGSKEARTPHLDRLAAGSAVFPNGYVPTSLCRASLATILTGQYASQHKICCNDPPEGVDRTLMHPFIKKAPALPRLLGAGGYVSLQTGKFWEGHHSNAGFTRGMTVKGRHGDDGLAIGRKTMKPVYDFIAGAGANPWMVWYAPMMPHEPHNPPDRLLKKYEAKGRHPKQAKYLAMIEWFDETVGELLGHLDAKKQADHTLVLFVVDNGWIQETGEKRTTRGWFAPRSKMSPYDGGLRTPIMIRWPGKVKPGRYEDLASTVDVAPTVLTAAGLPVPKEVSGVSLLDVAAGKGPLERKAVFGEIYEHTATDIDRPAVDLTHRWVREGAWKLIVPVKGKPELYDVGTDPHEKAELSAREPGRVKRLTGLVEGR
ncbi:MAG: sulfatase-like hydrolase/transferase, partial [Gemmataceae bacterium]